MAYSKQLIQAVLIPCILIFCACSSNHNLKEDGTNLLGGGYSEEMILPGFYKMSALSNRGLIVTQSAAEKTWRKRAEALCNGNGYHEFKVDSRINSSEAMPIHLINVGSFYLNEHQASKTGYFVCINSNVTVSSAKDYLIKQQKEADEKIAQRKREFIASLKYTSCESILPSNSDASYFQIGKELYKARKFNEARICFHKASIASKSKTDRDESNFHLGMIYELGQGVPSDIDQAKIFYAKAGMSND